MHPELQALIDEFDAAEHRLHALASAVSDETWTRRPAPARWSVAECVAHLNLTSRAYLTLLQDGLAKARGLARPAPRRYRRDPVGWLLWRTMGPPVRMRVKTIAAFVPESAEQLTMLPRHQHRHLWQAEQASGPSSSAP